MFRVYGLGSIILIDTHPCFNPQKQTVLFRTSLFHVYMCTCVHAYATSTISPDAKYFLKAYTLKPET
jgi:hypothetical protein